MRDHTESGHRHPIATMTLTFCLLSATVATVGPAAAAPPPKSRTYFTVFLGLDGPYSTGVDCLRFTATEVCALSGVCGSWSRTEPAGPETAIAFEFIFEEDGVPVQIDGQARIDGRGTGDTLAAAARLETAGNSVNFGFTGRPTGRRKCLRLLREWTRRHPPEQGEQNAACVERAEFADAAVSAYVLPYPVGMDYRVSQTYCFQGGGHRNQLAYDFATPVGSRVTAAHAGVVRQIREDLPDDGSSQDSGEHNNVFVEHDDGTVAFYAHLQQGGVLVEVGEQVEAGQLIAYSGNSGNTGGFPHLHFGVYRSWPVEEGDDVPVNFSNALGPLDDRGGLLRGVYYRAMPR